MTAIGFNLLFAVPGRVGGSEQYLARQVTSLLDHPRGSGTAEPVEPVVFALRGFAEAHPELSTRCPVIRARSDGLRRVRRVLAESTWLASRVRAADLALVHHGGGTVPANRGGVPAVVTLHDLQYLTYPATFSTVKLAYLREFVPRSMRRAAAVTVPSEYVRATVFDAFGLPADRVTVVPHPMPTAELASATGAAELRQRLGLRDAVLVLPAITYEHKGHATVIDALAALGRDDVSLVLLGGEGPAEAAVRAQIAERGLTGSVLRPGRVSDADRNGLLAMARGLVFPSRYEGFGAPVLEAMALGCPVLAADATALPEVVDDAGLLLPAGDVEAWATAIARLLDDDDLATTLATAGRARAEWFSPVRAADALLAAYRPFLP